jgi:hypothetical protein
MFARSPRIFGTRLYLDKLPVLHDQAGQRIVGFLRLPASLSAHAVDPDPGRAGGRRSQHGSSVKEQDTWAKEVFPGAYERLQRAAAAIEPGTPAQPFIDALTELVQAQADTTGFVGLHQWVEILERHFPPQLPDPDHTTE